jgi:hypothetical protein
MVHARLQKAVAMQSAPQPNGAQSRRHGEPLGRKIDLSFLRHEVDVGEHHDPAHRLFGDLGAPAGFSPGVKALALVEAEPLKKIHQVGKVCAGAAERMVIVVAPAEPEPILPTFLHLRGAVARLPTPPLFGEEEVTGGGAIDGREHEIELRERVPHAVGVFSKIATSGAPEFAGAQDTPDLLGRWFRHDEPAISESLDRHQGRAAILSDHGATQSGAKLALDLRSQVVRGDEICEYFRADRELVGDVAASSLRGNDHARHHGPRVMENGRACRRLHGFLHQAGGPQSGHLVGPQHQMVDPFEKQRTGLIPHAFGQPAGERVTREKSVDVSFEQIFRLVAERPVVDADTGTGGESGRSISDHGGVEVFHRGSTIAGRRNENSTPRDRVTTHAAEE